MISNRLSALDEMLYLRREIRLELRFTSTAFFTVGFLLIFAEILFYDYFADMANTPISTRHFIGFHLGFSELWFFVVGNGLLFLVLGENEFLVPRSVYRRALPLLSVLSVYTIWFVYGTLADNEWALEEFREMVFAAFCLPPVMYFGRYVDYAALLHKFILPCTFVLFVTSVADLHNATLIFGTFLASFYLLRLLSTSSLAIAGLALTTLPFVVKFSKPTIALLAFCLGISFLLAGYLNRRSVNWVLSRFKLRILFIGFLMLLGLIAAVALVNYWTGGAIEQIIRLVYLKERVTSSGAVAYADVSGGRLSIWKSVIISWTERPLIGYGLGAEVEAYSSGWVRKTQFHNYVVQGLHNTGALGLSVIVTGWFTWFRRTLRNVKSSSEGREQLVQASMLIFMLGLLFFGLFGHSFSFPSVTLLFWVFAGLLSSAPTYRHPEVAR